MSMNELQATGELLVLLTPHSLPQIRFALRMLYQKVMPW
ncbi:hypothetical protein M199_gp094 [Halogranum tailed virus 1]|uniref:Uncharacterized protein n=1 Tax=Halogranum tailed virus 1 TaxID=1273749 RepID=R4TLJ5_9CAUD|nr:hypothetical protein M199_gp094 [Halogranum tailed virus 1]AGM11572.1 hypothetical protein HGTV1_275 [Halogranum tailed virus 1]